MYAIPFHFGQRQEAGTERSHNCFRMCSSEYISTQAKPMGKDLKQISFRVQTEKLREQIEERTGYPATHDSPHQTVRDLLQRYLQIVERSLPDLDEEEWNVIFDVYNGTITEPWALKIAYANLEDTPESVYDRHGADKEDLVAKARDWSIAEATAVIDMAEQFWTATSKGEDFDQTKISGDDERSQVGGLGDGAR